LEFLSDNIDPSLVLELAYSPLLVIISFIIAILASYALLSVAERVVVAEKKLIRSLWVCFGALFMGAGVWVMHFIGMLGVILPVQMSFDLTIALLSAVPAILASGVALETLSHKELGAKRIILSGLCMGIGFGAMHYTGMAAMHIAAAIYYDPIIFAASILVAALLSILAIGTRFKTNKWLSGHKLFKILFSSVVMGFAVAGQHYTAMASANFVSAVDTTLYAAGDAEALMFVGLVVGVTLFVLLSAIAVAHINSRLAAAMILKQQKEHLNTIMETMADGLIVVDQVGIIQSFNRAALEIFGYPENEIVGKNIEMLMGGEGHNAHNLYPSNFLESGMAQLIGTGPHEVSGLNKKGQMMDMELSINMVKGVEEPYFVCSLRDITPRKKREAEARKISEQLRQAQKMESIGNLTGGIAHDFNNLLTAIKGSLSMMEMSGECPDEETRNLIDIANKATDRGAELTHRLLAFSRNQPLKPDLVDANELVRGFYPLLKRTLGEDVEIETHLTDREELIEVDPHQLENSLLNLAINGKHAMPEGGKLTIELEENEFNDSMAKQIKIKAGQYIVLSVSDNGCGMSHEVREKIFDPFFTTKSQGEGTGLGLSMVYGFVKQSGGHVTVYSEPGVGTTFKLYFPKKQGTKQETKQKVKRDIKKEKTPLLSTNKKRIILLVEDDEDVRNFITRALKTEGYMVLAFKDGPSALKVMETTPRIDLLFTDVVLPKGMDGPAIAKIFRQKYPESKVIFTSGYTGNAMQQNERLDEDDQFLSKPYGIEVLLERVRESIMETPEN